MNLTLTIGITEACFTWCKEQSLVHARNTEIYELVFIAIALVSLFIYNMIDNHNEALMESSGMTEHQILTTANGFFTLAYLMLILYIIYMVFFR